MTNDADIADKCRMLRNHGREPGDEKYDHHIEGFNSRMDSFQGVILNVKLRYIEKWTEVRRAAAASYNKLLSDLSLKVPSVSNDKAHYIIYTLFVVQNRELIQEKLKEMGVSTGIHYPTPI